MKRVEAPSKYAGGKYYLAPKIVEMANKIPHTHFVETHGGMLNVLLAKPFEGISEVVNDIDKYLTCFWQVLQDTVLFAEFERIVEAKPFSEVEWNNALLFFQRGRSGETKVDVAVNFFVLLKQSRQGLAKDFATLTRNRTRRGMNAEASAWLSSVHLLPEVHKRIARVVILDAQPVSKVLKTQDSPNTLFYVDPPYYPTTLVAKQQYRHIMTHEDHVEMLDLLSNIQGKFLLSGYDCELYETYRKRNKWKKTVIEIDNKASAKKVKDKKLECIWTNYTGG